MADADVEITAGTGTKIDTRTVGAGTDEHRQVVVIGDPTTASSVAAVINGGLQVMLASSEGTELGTVSLPITVQGNYAEDDGAVNHATGFPMLGVRNDGPTSRTSTDGDYSHVSVDDNGRLRVVIDAFNPGTITTKESSGTATLSNVSGSASSVTLLASNGNRRGAAIWNDSSAILYVKFGTTASTTSCTVKLVADAYYETPAGYTGRIDGIWASATGAARITELT